MLLAVLGPLVYWYGPAVFRIVTNKGELVIETDDPDVEVHVKRNGEQVTLVDTKSNKEITLQAGTYQLELAGDKDGLALSTNQFTLSRGGREVVKVRLEEVIHVGEIRRFEGHTNWVCRVCFCPDGRRILASGADGTLRTWDLKTGKQLQIFRGHKWTALWGLALSHNGDLAVSAGENWIRSWNMQTGKEIRRYPFHSSDVALSPDSRYGLAACGGGDFCMWALETGKEVRRFHGHKKGIWTMCFSPDGRRVLSGSGYPDGDRTARLWDAETGKELRCFKGHTGQVISVVFAPDGRSVVSGDLDGSIRLWDTESGKEIRSFRGHTGQVISLAISPDGRRLLSGSGDRSMRLWDVASGKELHRFMADKIQVRSVAFSADGRYALSGGADGIVRLGACRTHLKRSAPRIPLPKRNPNHSRLMSFAASPRTAAARKPTRISGMTCMAWRSRRMAVCLAAVRAASFASGISPRERCAKQWRLGNTVTHVSLTPDHRLVLCGVIRKGWMGFVLFDPNTGKEVRRFPGRETWPTDAIFSPNGRQMIASGQGSRLVVWDVATGARLRDIVTPLWVTRMTASADFHWALSCSQWKNTAWLWDIASGKAGPTLVGHRDGIVALALSVDGRRTLTGGKDKTVRLWDVKSGKELQRFEGHTDTVSSVAFSPRGPWILSGAADHTLRLWDGDTGKEIRCFKGHTGKITTALFMRDGRQAISGSADQSIRLWRLPDPPLEKEAAKAALKQ